MQKSTGSLGLILAGMVVAATGGAAQVPAILNYQGRVAVDGTNFNGTGQFQFALVDGGTDLSRSATAISHRTGLFVTSVEITDGGAGYVEVPAVAFSGGGGAGATAHAEIGGGAVTNIVLDGTGSGYTSDPDVVFEAPPVNISYAVFWSNGAPVDVAVVKGLYAVALGDTEIPDMAALPPEVFTNADVRLRVTFDDGANGPQTLAPDSRLAAAGYALMAHDIRDGAVTGAKLADGTVGDADLADEAVTGAKLADGEVAETDLADEAVTSVKIADGTLVPGDLAVASFSNTFWKTDGNAGTTPGTHYLGTPDNQALEFKVNSERVLRVEPDGDSPKWAAGYSGNVAAAAGAVVAGGGASGASFLGFGPNLALANFSAIGGGSSNTIQPDADHGAIAGGAFNTIERNAWNNFIGGGYGNAIQTNAATSVIGGGRWNTVKTIADNSVIGGGRQNTIENSASNSVIAGGWSNRVDVGAYGSAIGGGFGNTIQTNVGLAFIGGGGGNVIQTNAWYGFVGGGSENTIEMGANCGVIGGGVDNAIRATANHCVIGGGYLNIISTNSRYAAIGGGNRNGIQTNADHSAIGGGTLNRIGNNSSNNVIAGGWSNRVDMDVRASAIGGGANNAIQTNADNSVIGGGWGNKIRNNADYGVIGGGNMNVIQTNAGYCAIVGGDGNTIETNASGSAIVGGQLNKIEQFSFYSFIGGGSGNLIETNAINGAIPGGIDCTISNNVQYAFAGGRRAKAGHIGSFVWADSQNSNFGSTASNEVSFRCQGGVRFVNGASQASWVPGDGSWTIVSDQEMKEGFAAVDAAAVLEKVAALPLSWWVYQGYDVRHIGPMAQDFHAAFDLGRDPKGLDGADLDGVALAAIQGLYKENQDLKARVTELERKVELLMEKLPQ